MVDFPSGLRMAAPGDEARLFALFVMAHAENGYGDIDVLHVQDVIARGCRSDGVVIALVDGPERIEAAIGLHPDKQWYSSTDAKNWFHTDLLIYVHPLHRKSRHAMKLLKFAQWWEHETNMPVVLSLMPKDDFEDKERLFERFSRKIGALYMIGGADEWPQKIGVS